MYVGTLGARGEKFRLVGVFKARGAVPRPPKIDKCCGGHMQDPGFVGCLVPRTCIPRIVEPSFTSCYGCTGALVRENSGRDVSGDIISCSSLLSKNPAR